MEGLGKLTYELPSTNILNKVTLEHQNTHSMTENTIHMCLFLFSSHFIHFFSDFFFQNFFLKHIYKCTNPEHKQMNSKYDINNG